MGTCQLAAAVKYCRDVTIPNMGGKWPLITEPGRIALASTPQNYRDSRLWEFSYNASRVTTLMNNAQSGARAWGVKQHPLLGSDLELSRLASVCLRWMREKDEPLTSARIMRCLTRIQGLTPSQQMPDLETLFR